MQNQLKKAITFLGSLNILTILFYTKVFVEVLEFAMRKLDEAPNKQSNEIT